MGAIPRPGRGLFRVTGRFAVDHRSWAPADAFGAARTEWPTVPTLTWWTIARPVLVLGSTQSPTVVDQVAADRFGVEVVTRASGGGAVLLEPGAALWVDVVVPAGDPAWGDDVVTAGHWIGDGWVNALTALGMDRSDLSRHGGGLVSTEWSKLVCFAGIGPAEVTYQGKKLVGISQRRSRAGARFQIAILRKWEPMHLLRLLTLDDEQFARARAALEDVAIGLDLPEVGLRGEFEAAVG